MGLAVSIVQIDLGDADVSALLSEMGDAVEAVELAGCGCGCGCGCVCQGNGTGGITGGDG